VFHRGTLHLVHTKSLLNFPSGMDNSNTALKAALSPSTAQFRKTSWSGRRKKQTVAPSMTMRTTNKTVTFHRPFCLKGVDRLLPPADYRVMTDEELIEGLSFPAYRRVSTAIFVPASSGSAIEMVTIDPLDLQAAQELDTMPDDPATAREF
jgi:hypothetical protein